LVAAEEGRQGVGLDLNPLGLCVSRAKADVPDIASLLDRIETLKDEYSNAEVPDEHLPSGLGAYFHSATLSQLVFLKNALGIDRVDNFIKATIVGILHGRGRGKAPGSVYLSVDMPNTFSMSPRYVERYVETHRLRAVPYDAFQNLRRRVLYLLEQNPGGLSGSVAREGDATNQASYLGLPSPALVLTSPPYLGVLRYGAFNWLRLWFLGYDARAVDISLMSTGSPERYLAFMLSFLTTVYDFVAPGGRLIIIVGELRNRRLQNLARVIADDVVPLSRWQIDAIERDVDVEDTKTTRIWGDAKRGRASGRDDALILLK
jgi:site-specific DNA-methyltransferase (adenine-specific)